MKLIRIIPLILIALVLIPSIYAAGYWNTSYAYRKYINCTNMTFGVPLLINSSWSGSGRMNGGYGLKIDGVPQYIWTYCAGNTTALYFTNSTKYAIANATKRLPFDIENGTGVPFNSSGVWKPLDYIGVFHMRNTSGIKGTNTSAHWISNRPPTATGLDYLFNGDSVNTTVIGALGATFNLMLFYTPHITYPSTAYGGIFEKFSSDDYGCIFGSTNQTMRCLMSGSYCDRTFNFGNMNNRTYMITLIHNGTNSSVYENYTLLPSSSKACTYSWTIADKGLQVGLGDRDARQFNGYIDEIRISNSSIKATNLTRIYNNFKGTIGFGNIFTSITTGMPPIVYYNDNSTVNVFRGGYANYTLIINKSSWTDANASLIWNGTKYSPTKTGTGNWTFRYNKLFPNSPGKSISYYWIMNSTNINGTLTNQLTSSNTQNIVDITFGVCAGSLNTSALNINIYNENNNLFLNNTYIYGNYNYWISDKTSPTNGTFSFTIYNDSISNTNNFEGNNQTTSDASDFDINVTFTALKYSIISQVSFLFKNMASPLTLRSTDLNFTVRLNNCTEGNKIYNHSWHLAPLNKSFSMNFTLSNYSTYLIPNTQYCYQLRSLNVSSSYNELYYNSIPQSFTGSLFTYSSQNLNTHNTFYGNGTSIKLNEISLSSVNSSFCIYPSTGYLHLDMEIFYNTSFLERYYLLNASLSNSLTTLTLYGISDSTGYETAKVSLVDLSYSPLINYYVKLLRWYPSKAAWELVQMDKSDEFGNTYFHVLQTNTDYKFVIQDYDTTLKTTSPVKFFKPYGGDIINIIAVNIDASQEGIFTSYNYSYNNVSKIFIFNYNDVSGITTKMNLQAYTDGSTGRVLWCNSNASGSAGSINCNVSRATGSVSFIVTRTAGSISVIFGTTISTLVNELYKAMESSGMGKDSIFYSAILVGIILLAGAYQPITLLLSIPIGLILINLLGISNFVTYAMLIGSAIFALVLGILVKKW